jgi:hypothetical protein
MARVLPQASEAELTGLRSRAEAQVYRCCLALPGRALVLFGLETLEIGPKGAPQDGEADFVIVDPAHGVLVLEVKGGGVAYDAGLDTWTSQDRHGKVHEIRDPFQQARQRKYGVLNKIKAFHGWASLGSPRLLVGHCVIFPDLDDTTAIDRADAPNEIIGNRRQLARFAEWVESVFQYWRGKDTGSALGERGLQVIERVLAASFAVEPRIGARIQAEDVQRGYWTDSQWQALQGMRHWKRLAIAGGAGTGKTLLAVRRAQELASQGQRTLLLCFNSGLGDFLKRENHQYTKHGGANENWITSLTFHELCSWWCRVVGPKLGRDFLKEAAQTSPGKSEWDVHWPLALAYAVEEDQPKYDAIIVDEGQDFGDDFWLPIELISDSKALTVFFDPNQDLYRRSKAFPIDAERTYNLQANCRNTGTIHTLAYTYYAGPNVTPPPLVGPAVQHWHGASVAATARKIANGVANLIHKEGVARRDIAVLLFDSSTKHSAYRMLGEEFARLGINPKPERHDLGDSIVVDTVARFKGLEAAVVVLWLNTSASQLDKRLLYVATSRPRSLLVLAGEAAACSSLGQPN